MGMRQAERPCLLGLVFLGLAGWACSRGTGSVGKDGPSDGAFRDASQDFDLRPDVGSPGSGPIPPSADGSLDVPVAMASPDVRPSAEVTASADLVGSVDVRVDLGPDRVPENCTRIKTPPRPSLSGKVPGKVLWQTELSHAPVRQAVALWGDTLAVGAGNFFQFFDARTGKIKVSTPALQFTLVSAPVADTRGNFYFANIAFSAFTNGGALIWERDLRRDGMANNVNTSPLLLSPDNIAYSLQLDGRFVAIDTNQKGLPNLWESLPPGYPLTPTYNYQLLAGIDDKIVAQVRGNSFQVHARADGKLLARVEIPEKQEGDGAGRFELFDMYGVARGYGVLTRRWKVLASQSALQASGFSVSVYGLDGALKWSTPAGRPERPLFVDLDGYLVFGTVKLDTSPDTPLPAASILRRYSCGGIAEEPTAVVTPEPTKEASTGLVGADGIAYVFMSDPTRGLGSTLVALDTTRDYREIWRVDLGARVFLHGAALSDEGVLYVGATNEKANSELVAIQTTSPGLAKTGWPTFRHDNRQTGWVNP